MRNKPEQLMTVRYGEPGSTGCDVCHSIESPTTHIILGDRFAKLCPTCCSRLTIYLLDASRLSEGG